MTSKAYLLSLLLTMVASAATAQVVARQGQPASIVKEFKSPMILDLPLTGYNRFPPQASKEFKEVRDYSCDGVVLTSLALTRIAGSRRDGGAVIQIKGTLLVPPSRDRLVTLRFHAFNGDRRGQQLGQVRTYEATPPTNLKAEERKTRNFSARIVLRADDYAELFAATATPLLQVTMVVKDDD